MRFLRLIAVVSMLFPSGPSVAQDWIHYFSTTDLFSIHTPGEFEVQDITYPSEYGAIFPARVYSYEDGANRYAVTVVDYTDSQRIHTERTDRTEADYLSVYWEVDVRASVAYAAWNLRQRGGEVTYDAYHYIDLVEGHQLQMTNADQTRTYAGIYLHDSRLYIVEATVSPGSVPPGFFQQSLQFIDEAGDRIRYRNYSDAVKVRNARVRAPQEANRQR